MTTDREALSSGSLPEQGAPVVGGRPPRCVRTVAASPGAATVPFDLDHVARRALDVGRRTALGVLAGDHATADDVAQEVAIEAVRHVHRLRDADALDAWLYRSATRAALRAVRRGRRRRSVEEDHMALSGRGEQEPTTPGDDLDRLLARLPERQRAALTLRYVHDLDDDRIAAAIGCRPGSVRALLSRGRAALRDHLDTRTVTGDHDA